LANFPVKTKDRVTIGNLKARIRMASLYFIANARNLLVAGTGDRSEDLIGYFTKYGDGGVDFLPIAHLYKTQVKALGRHLGLPIQILNKPSSPNLWEGHKATDEIPLDYNMLDLALVSLFDLKMRPKEAAAVLEIDEGKLEEILRLYNASGHKRAYPPMVRGW
jgi:NAD+ synthase